MNVIDYEQIAGYKPIPGQPCPDCKRVCGPGGPDHNTTCGIVAKLWTEHKNNGAAIPEKPTELSSNSEFQIWVVKLASTLFREPIPHHQRVAHMQASAPTPAVAVAPDPVAP